MRLFALRFLQVTSRKSQTMVGLSSLARSVINRLKESEMASINTNNPHHTKNQLWLPQDIKDALDAANITSIIFRKRANTEFTLPKRSTHIRLIKDALRHITLYGRKIAEETVLYHKGKSITIIPSSDVKLVHVLI